MNDSIGPSGKLLRLWNTKKFDSSYIGIVTFHRRFDHWANPGHKVVCTDNRWSVAVRHLMLIPFKLVKRTSVSSMMVNRAKRKAVTWKAAFIFNGPFPTLFLYFRPFNTVDSKKMFSILFCRWLDSNWDLLWPTDPQPLPAWLIFGTIMFCLTFDYVYLLKQAK